jgi:hypothetical protein
MVTSGFCIQNEAWRQSQLFKDSKESSHGRRRAAQRRTLSLLFLCGCRYPWLTDAYSAHPSSQCMMNSFPTSPGLEKAAVATVRSMSRQKNTRIGAMQNRENCYPAMLCHGRTIAKRMEPSDNCWTLDGDSRQ